MVVRAAERRKELLISDDTALGSQPRVVCLSSRLITYPPTYSGTRTYATHVPN
jgi:hypothetical protein